jgi:iron complex transport system substrate-binding protein
MKTRRSLLVGACRFAAILALAAAASTASADATRTFTDMLGRSVVVPARVDRAVGTGGAVDEWFVLLGAADKLVATSTTIHANPWFARIDPDIARVPEAFSNAGVNVETLLATRPQVAFLLAGVETQKAIEQAGIPVIVLERRNPEELMAGIRLAAQILGPQEEAAAARFTDYYRANIRRVRARTDPLPPARRPRVYYGSGDALSTEGSDTLVDAWISLGGGINVASAHGIAGMGRRISLESLVLWQPDIIITNTAANRAAILANPALRALPAVQGGRVYVNPKGVYSWGVRSADEALQVLWAAKTIHPELFPDLDIAAEVKRFHRDFYHHEMSDDDVARMLRAEPPG